MPQFPDGTRLRQFDSRGYSSIRDCSHVYSDGSNVTAIFPDRQDKYRILDLLAVAAFETGVRILVAEVMTTHFHAIVSGTETCREQFKVSVWRKLAAWVARNGLDGCISGGLALINDPIKETDELKSKIMYVYRNSLCAGIPLVPWQYEGGPGDIYFIDHAHEGLKGIPLSDLPARKVREYFHTMAKLPPSWRYDEVERRLLPHSYMDWSRVEGLFKTLRAFVAFLAQKKDLETKFDLECAAGAINKASEKDLRLEILVQGDLPSGQGVFGKSGTTDRTGGQALGFRTDIFTFRPQPDSFTPQGLSSSAFLCGLTRPALTEPTLVSGFAPSLSPVSLLSLCTHASNLPVGPAASSPVASQLVPLLARHVSQWPPC